MKEDGQKLRISKQRFAEILMEEYNDAIASCGCQDVMSDDPEGSFAKQQLSTIIKSAQELSEIIQDETQLESWVQSKLTKAADYLKTVKEYVEYGAEEGAYDQASTPIPAEFVVPAEEEELYDFDPETMM